MDRRRPAAAVVGSIATASLTTSVRVEREATAIESALAGGHEDEWDYIAKPLTGREMVQEARHAMSSWTRRRRDESESQALRAAAAWPGSPVSSAQLSAVTRRLQMTASAAR